ncbi:MAG: type II toxin-antitoxin system VapB family antitoxin [Pseudomonadota bacterium]|jgi:Arc/MetJ family transcription regulator
MEMRTNIVLDDRLVEEAMALAGLRTKRELVDHALREFVALRKRLDVRVLRGADLIADDYDHRRLREGRVAD